MDWTQLRRIWMSSSLHLWEVVSRADGESLTCGCLLHCQRYVNRLDPNRYRMRIKRSRM